MGPQSVCVELGGLYRQSQELSANTKHGFSQAPAAVRHMRHLPCVGTVGLYSQVPICTMGFRSSPGLLPALNTGAGALPFCSQPRTVIGNDVEQPYSKEDAPA